MNGGAGEDSPGSITGLPIEDAVEVVVAREDDASPDAVRAALERVSEDGVVSRDGVDATLAHASKVVSTPETRVELASMALADAREAAASVDDRSVVRTRLEGFETRLDAVESRTADLGGELQRLVDLRGDPASMYEVARGIRRLTGEANSCQQAADELAVDLEAFERWVGNPDVRYRELAEDVDAVAGSLDELAETVDALARAHVGDGSDGGEVDDGAADWLDATFRHRAMALVLADLRWERAELDRWAAEEDVEDRRAKERDEAEYRNEVEERIDDLEVRRESIGERLDDLARSEWVDRYEEHLAAVEGDLDAFEPPIAWDRLQATLDSHRAEIDSAGYEFVGTG